MKNLILLSIIASLALIYSCSDNSVTTPTPQVLYSIDSLSIWLNPPGGASGGDSVYYSSQQSGSVKVEFTLESNADSLFATGNAALYTNATPDPAYSLRLVTNVQQQNSFTMSFASGTTYFALAVRMDMRTGTIPYYARMKNVKITKL
jgi:hypothetical protein